MAGFAKTVFQSTAPGEPSWIQHVGGHHWRDHQYLDRLGFCQYPMENLGLGDGEHGWTWLVCIDFRPFFVICDWHWDTACLPGMLQGTSPREKPRKGLADGCHSLEERPGASQVRSQPTSSVISPLEIFINAGKTPFIQWPNGRRFKTSAKYENHIFTYIYIPSGYLTT